jgi:hypothetical protein
MFIRHRTDETERRPQSSARALTRRARKTDDESFDAACNAFELQSITLLDSAGRYPLLPTRGPPVAGSARVKTTSLLVAKQEGSPAVA